MTVVDELRAACRRIAQRARHVRVDASAIEPYASTLDPPGAPPALDPAFDRLPGALEARAAAILTLDAVNFGSGWFPTLRKRHGRSGYFTIALGLRERFERHGPWRAEELTVLEARGLAAVLGQDPGHELMALHASALRDLGARVGAEADGRFLGVVERADGSAVALAERLGRWPAFSDVSTYAGERVPFLKRAQIAAADLGLAGVAHFADLDRLTMFADNLVPHVLRLDGVLRYDPRLLARIEAAELLEHGSPEEVEIRACALHAVELLVAAGPGQLSARAVDRTLWNRGQEPRYKAHPRHRSRCTAY